jgi:hypothetical protein
LKKGSLVGRAGRREEKSRRREEGVKSAVRMVSTGREA